MSTVSPKPRREVRWERMFPDELESAIAAKPVVYFAYGLCEPHGPHNALGLDGLKAYAVCCRAAAEHGGIVAPADMWHCHELGLFASWGFQRVGEVQPYLTAVPPWVHFKNVCYHVRAADAAGFHAAILFTGHYGPNWRDLKTLVGILQPHFAMRIYGLPEFEANRPGFDVDGKSNDHAGKVETSLLLALEPECVDLSRLPTRPGPDEPRPLHFAMGWNAYQSSQRIGERMAADEVRFLGQKADEMLAEYAASPPVERSPLSFEQIEVIWDNEVRPVFKEFRTMQYLDRPAPPPESRWRVNYEIPDRS